VAKDRRVNARASVLELPDAAFLHQWSELSDEERSAIGAPGFARFSELMRRFHHLTATAAIAWDEEDTTVEHVCGVACDLLKAASDNLSGANAEVTHG